MAEQFETVLTVRGTTATFIEVPEKVVAALSSRKRFPVKATIKGYTYRSTVGPMGGVFLLPVNRGNRERAGVEAGESILVTLEVDTEERRVEVPAELARALRGDAAARRFFEQLSFTHQREYAEWIGEAKRPETRARRAAKALALLAEGRKQR